MNLEQFRVRIKERFEKSKSYVRTFGFSYAKFVVDDWHIDDKDLANMNATDVRGLYEELGYCLALDSVLDDLKELE